MAGPDYHGWTHDLIDPIPGLLSVLKFDTHPQIGGWLYVETTTSSGSPNGYGTELVDASAGGIHILETFASGGAILIENQDDGGIKLYDEHGGGEFELAAGSIIARPGGGDDFRVDLQTGGALVVRDSGGTPIFQVDEDGTITPSMGGSGIQFETAESGGYLDITTTDAGGISIWDNDLGGGSGLLLYSANNQARLAGANVSIEAESSDVQILASAPFTLINLTAPEVSQNGDTVSVYLNAGGNLIVYDSSSAPVFRVDEPDGSVHILTGTSVQADL